ncbi:hypothetical protein [Acidovorax sp. M2(2025)]|uniref:hypothetical protein n=1 Tax=Acidovorax sp. M2(2025) TaxID=3411355 RepID=UPI003BF5A6C2
MEKYVPSMVRSAIRTHQDSTSTAAAISAYEIWKRQEGTVWLDEESRYYATRNTKEVQEKAQKQVERERDAQLKQAREHFAIAESARLAAVQAEARETLVERHQTALEASGRKYLGVRASSAPRGRRITHCYACKQHLDNTIDIECVACGWILCLCSACGCGYQREA